MTLPLNVGYLFLGQGGEVYGGHVILADESRETIGVAVENMMEKAERSMEAVGGGHHLLVFLSGNGERPSLYELGAAIREAL